MKWSVGRRVSVCLIAVVALLWAADEYPAMRFRGDGRFSGGPVWGYQIEFKKIPFYVPGEYLSRFRGVPHEDLVLELHAKGKSGNEADLRVKTVIEAAILDQKGHAVCEASGPPLEHGQNPNGWVVMQRGDESAYWHWNCAFVGFQPSNSYTMTLRIRDVDPKTPKINLSPALRSRGPEWP